MAVSPQLDEPIHVLGCMKVVEQCEVDHLSNVLRIPYESIIYKPKNGSVALDFGCTMCTGIILKSRETYNPLYPNMLHFQITLLPQAYCGGARGSAFA